MGLKLRTSRLGLGPWASRIGLQFLSPKHLFVNLDIRNSWRPFFDNFVTIEMGGLVNYTSGLVNGTAGLVNDTAGLVNGAAGLANGVAWLSHGRGWLSQRHGWLCQRRGMA